MDKLIYLIATGSLSEFAQEYEQLRASGVDVDQAFSVADHILGESLQHTFFSLACRYGRLDICKYLADKGLGSAAASQLKEGFPLVIAVLYGQFHVADWLQEEFNIDCSINDSVPLCESAFYSKTAGIKYSLEHGAEATACKNFSVMETTSKGLLRATKELVRYGADLHADEEYGLRWASNSGHLKMVQYLVSKGADVHARNDEALRNAVWKDHTEVAAFLLDHGANPNAKDGQGCVLQWMVEKNQTELVKKALDCGADLKMLPEDLRQKAYALLLEKVSKRGKSRL